MGGKRFAAGKTHDHFGFIQRRVHRNTLVKDETIAVPMVAAHVLKVPENAAFELLHVGEARFDHDGTGLLTSDAPGAEHDNGFILHGLGKLLDGLGKRSESPNIEVDGVVKGP